MVGLGDQAEAFVPGGAQLMVVWNEQDRLGEILDDARRLFGSDRFRGVPSGRVVLAYFEAVAGDRAVAADALPHLAASWSTTQRDPNWLMGLAWLCRTAVVLEDVESAAILLELGRPHASRSVFTAAGTITLGVLGMWLAEVAILLGRHDEAAALLDAAEAHYRRLQDRGHLVECEYLRGRLAAAAGRADAAALLGAAAAEADALGMARVARLARSTADAAARPPIASARDEPPARGVFRREGDVWLVRFGGVDARVRDTKGMADLAVLLARPGVEVHVAELVGAAVRARRVGLDAGGARRDGDRRVPDAAAGAVPPRRTTPTRPATPCAPPGRGPSARRSPTSSPPTWASAAPRARRRTGSSGPARPSGAGSTPRSSGSRRSTRPPAATCGARCRPARSARTTPPNPCAGRPEATSVASRRARRR